MTELSGPSLFIQLVPFLLYSATLGVVANLLAKEKGRDVLVWTLVGVVPFVNFIGLFFFVGAANLRLERKIDQLLQDRGQI